jgi:predicted nucleic acid-binding protein
MRWCFDDDATQYAKQILQRLSTEEAWAPALWPSEVANVLLVGERRRLLTPADSSRFVALLQTLPIRVDTTTAAHIWSDVLPVARSHQLSAYDAAYLELSMRLGCPIATLDGGVRRAAKPLGIELAH